jgi:hypothetical protein
MNKSILEQLVFWQKRAIKIIRLNVINKHLDEQFFRESSN